MGVGGGVLVLVWERGRGGGCGAGDVGEDVGDVDVHCVCCRSREPKGGEVSGLAVFLLSAGLEFDEDERECSCLISGHIA